MLKWKDISERKENDYIPLYFNVDDFRYNYIYRIPNDIGADLFIPKKHQDKIHNIFIQIKHGETLLGYEDKAGSNKFACQTIRAHLSKARQGIEKRFNEKFGGNEFSYEYHVYSLGGWRQIVERDPQNRIKPTNGVELQLHKKDEILKILNPFLTYLGSSPGLLSIEH